VIRREVRLLRSCERNVRHPPCRALQRDSPARAHAIQLRRRLEVRRLNRLGVGVYGTAADSDSARPILPCMSASTIHSPPGNS
jgi:hypothetical protein